MFVHRKQGLFLSVCVDDIKMAGKKQNMACMWKKLMKNVDIDEPNLDKFLNFVYLGCTQCECKPNETITEQNRKMFESRISTGATEKLSGWQKYHAQTVASSYDMEGQFKNASSDTVSWQTRRINSSTKYQLHALMTTTSKKKK